MANLRLGFVGVGTMGQAAHLQNYLSLPDCDVVALAEIRPQLGRKVAARCGVPKVYSNHREMLENERLDGIVAIQQFGTHAELIPQLLATKVPVLTEKPLADSVANGQAVLSAARATGTPLYLAYHKRSDPATGMAKQQMTTWQASGEVGKLRYIRLAMPPGDWIAQGFWQLVTSDEAYRPNHGMDTPYGRFVNYYIHQINLLRFLFGDDYQVISADPTGVTMTVLSKSGICGTLEMATHTTSVDWQEQALICFEHGWIKLDLPAPLAINRPGNITIFKDPGTNKGDATTTTVTLPWIHAMRSQAMNFIKAIKGEATPLCSAEDGLRDLQAAQRYIELHEEAVARASRPA